MLIAAITIELLGISTVGIGIGLLVAYGASPPAVIIPIGSVLVAAGGIIWGKFIRGKNVISKD